MFGRQVHGILHRVFCECSVREKPPLFNVSIQLGQLWKNELEDDPWKSLEP